MNKKDFQKGIADVRKLQMTVSEKSSVLRAVFSTPILSPLPTPSPWGFELVRVMIHSRVVMYSFAGLMVFSLSTTSAALVAEGALPGDVLYPMKVSVTEPLRDALQITPEAQATWTVEKITRRLQEAETLAANGKLDSVNRAKIEDNFNKNVEVYSTIALELEATSSVPVDDDSNVAFEANVTAHAKIIDRLQTELKNGEKKELQNLQKNISEKINKAYTQKVKSFKVSTPTLGMADVSTSTQTDFVERSAKAQEAIKKAKNKLNQAKSDKNKFRQAVIEDSVRALQEATDALNQARQDNGNKKGNEAMEQLRESLRAATEADVSIQDGLNIDQNGDNKWWKSKREGKDDQKDNQKDNQQDGND